jgi:multidrug efflux pump subunit AcrA (membrane-fusion protein)
MADDTSPASPAPNKPSGANAALWLQATPEQQQVLQRIAQQRQRLKARAAAVQQARALRLSASQVRADAPLAERVMTFARLHPVAVAVAAAAALVIGPRRLMRFGSAAMPWIIRWQQRR